MSLITDEHDDALPHSSQLRQRQKDLTRELIMEALVQILDRDRRYEFSMQEVADLAGLSHRCLYDYFPTREILLDEFAGWINEKVGERWIPSLPSSAEELPAWTRHKFEQVDRQPAMTRAATVARLAKTSRSPSARRTDEKFRELVGELAPDLHPDTLKRVCAILRYLSSGQTWLVLTEQMALSGEEAGKAASWAVEILVESLKDRRTAQQAP